MLNLIKQQKTYQIILGLLLGIVLYQISFGILILLGIIIYLGFFYKTKYLILIIFILFGLLYGQYSSSQIQDSINRIVNKDVLITATVVEDPLKKDFYQEVVVNPNGMKINLLVQLDKYLDINTGDVITLKTNFTTPEQSDYFDRITYLKSRKIFLESKTSTVIKVEEHQYSLTVALNKLKQKLSNILTSNLKEPQSTLAKGLIIGDDTNFSNEIKQNLKNSGLSHITSVSGYNVGIIFIGILFLTKFIKRKIVLISGIILIFLFWQLVGINNLPTERATLMLSFITLGLILGRRISYFYGIMLSTLFILMDYPGYFFNISFQLSFAAIIALLVLGPRLFIFLKKLKIENMFTKIFATSIAVLVFTIPISYFTFGQISSLGIISNILVLPLIPIATSLIVLSLMLSLLNITLLSTISFLFLDYVLRWIVLVINKIGSLSFSSVSNPVLVLILFSIFSIPVIFITLKYKNE